MSVQVLVRIIFVEFSLWVQIISYLVEMFVDVSFREIVWLVRGVASLPFCKKFDSIIFFLLSGWAEMLKLGAADPVLGLDRSFWCVVSSWMRGRASQSSYPIRWGHFARRQVNWFLCRKWQIFQTLSSSSKLLLRLRMIWKTLSILSLDITKRALQMRQINSREPNHLVSPDHS